MIYLDKVRILKVLACQGVTRMFCQTVFYFLYVCHLDVSKKEWLNISLINCEIVEILLVIFNTCTLATFKLKYC